MARPKAPSRSTAMQQVSGNRVSALAGSAAIYRPRQATKPSDDRRQIAKAWQIEAYRHVNICGEARYAATLFAAISGRAEIGISEPNALAAKPQWINQGPEVDALAEIAPSVRERSKLIRDYMLHRTIAGECYLIARERQPNDPGYQAPPKPFKSWDEVVADKIAHLDLFDIEAMDKVKEETNPNSPVWEIVAVTEIRRTGSGEEEKWEVRYDNENWIALSTEDPVIRMWNPDPDKRREAWSPFRSMLPTLREIEYFTKHIFTQVQSRLMSAGVWFVPNNVTYPPPPPDAVQGGAEAIARMNPAQQFMVSLAASSMQMLAADEVSFPTIVMADPAALAMVDQNKLIKFWSEIDSKAMELRSDAVRRFALGMDLPPEQVLGSSGLAVTGAGGSAGSVNHWGVWANEEQTISAHIEPALDDFVSVLTVIIRQAVENTTKVVGYGTAALRLRQDRSKEAIQLFDRGLLNGKTTVREVGFDPDSDMMEDDEFRKFLLMKLAGGSATPEQVQAAFALLGVDLPVAETPAESTAPGQPPRNVPPSLKDYPYEGPPREQHDHSPAPFSAREAAAEVLVLRALEKAGNRLLNDGKRGKDRDRETPPILAHVTASVEEVPEFDFSLAVTVFSDLNASQLAETERQLAHLCADLYRTGTPYTREALVAGLGEKR